MGRLFRSKCLLFAWSVLYKHEGKSVGKGGKGQSWESLGGSAQAAGAITLTEVFHDFDQL